MQELDDNALLRKYVEHDSQEAFAALVTRHVNKVYSVALRQTGNPHQAEEITQAVFVILARKSRQLGRHVLLAGWLYQAARLTALTHIRGEIRRARREQEAHMQTALNEDEPEVWAQIAPLLEEAMAGLNATDRHAIVLRFFDGKSIPEIGAALGANEAAARKRVDRALEKLHRFLSQRGVRSTTAMIAGAISTHSVQAAPVTLAQTATTAALAGGPAAAASPLVKGALKLMAWTKAKTVVLTGVAVLLAAGATTVAVKQFSSPSVEDVFEHYEDDSKLARVPPMVILRPSRYANKGSWINGSGEKFLGRGRSLTWMLSDAFGYGPERMILPADLPSAQFDYLVTVPTRSKEALQAEIKRQFGLVGRVETRDTDVFVLHAGPSAPALKAGHGGKDSSILIGSGKLTLTNFKMPALADALAGYFFQKPVINETALPGSYDLELDWNGGLKGSAEQNAVIAALREQFGLELVPVRRPVEMLVVEYADHHELEPPLPQAAWLMTGHATPEDAFQSALWAMSQGDTTTYLDSITPEFQKRALKNTTPAQSAARLAAENRHKAGEIVAYQVLYRETLSDNEAILYLRSTRLRDGQVTMKKIHGEWKLDEDPH